MRHRAHSLPRFRGRARPYSAECCPTPWRLGSSAGIIRPVFFFASLPPFRDLAPGSWLDLWPRQPQPTRCRRVRPARATGSARQCGFAQVPGEIRLLRISPGPDSARTASKAVGGQQGRDQVRAVPGMLFPPRHAKERHSRSVLVQTPDIAENRSWRIDLMAARLEACRSQNDFQVRRAAR